MFLFHPFPVALRSEEISKKQRKKPEKFWNYGSKNLLRGGCALRLLLYNNLMVAVNLKEAKKVDKINNLIRKTILEAVQEIFSDPDRGLELQDWVKRRLGKPARNLVDFKEVVRRSR